MTGKQFKEFAQLVPDNAVIEIDRFGWVPVNPEQIRAHLIVTPQKHEPECIPSAAPDDEAALRNLQTVNG